MWNKTKWNRTFSEIWTVTKRLHNRKQKICYWNLLPQAIKFSIETLVEEIITAVNEKNGLHYPDKFITLNIF